MAFVNVPKDLSKVKTKIALNLTKRQLICFGIAAVIRIPSYLFSRSAIGNSAAALLMITLMFPMFFMGIYEKDGMPAEIILRNYIRSRFLWSNTRPFITENLYEILAKEENGIANQDQTTAKTVIRKRSASKRKPHGHQKDRP